MDLGMLIATAIASIAAVASAVVAIVQARAAKGSEIDATAARDESRKARDESERLSREANAAFVRQAEAQEKANALREAELKPPTWSGPRFVSGQMFAMTNSSGRTIKVEQFEIDPDNAESMIRIYGKKEGIYSVGDSFEYAALRTYALRPEKLTIVWRFEDEPEGPLGQFIVPL